MQKVKNTKLKRINLKIDEETYNAILKSSISNNNSISEEVRIAIKEYLKIKNREENLDDTVNLIHEAMSIHIKNLGNRLASLLNRNTIISATSYYANLTMLSEISSRTTFNDYKSIEKRARKYALNYANMKNNQSLVNFAKDESLENVLEFIKTGNKEKINQDQDDFDDYQDEDDYIDF